MEIIEKLIAELKANPEVAKKLAAMLGTETEPIADEETTSTAEVVEEVKEEEAGSDEIAESPEEETIEEEVKTAEAEPEAITGNEGEDVPGAEEPVAAEEAGVAEEAIAEEAPTDIMPEAPAQPGLTLEDIKGVIPHDKLDKVIAAIEIIKQKLEDGFSDLFIDTPKQISVEEETAPQTEKTND